MNLPDAINCSISKEYTAIPNEIIRSPELSFKAKAILNILLSNKKGWKSYKTSLSKMCKESMNTIEKGIKELEEHGYLARIRIRCRINKQWKGSFWAYTDQQYSFNIKEQVETLIKQGFEPHTKNPHLDLPHVVNCILKKLNIKNTKKEKKQSGTNFIRTRKVNGCTKVATQPKKQLTPKTPPKQKTLFSFYKNFPFFKNEFAKIWNEEFLPLKKRKKAACTERALKSQLKKIAKYSNNDYEIALQILENSVNGGWSDVYALKKQYNNETQPEVNRPYGGVVYRKGISYEEHLKQRA